MLDVKLKLSPQHISKRTWMAPAPMQMLFWNSTYQCNYRCKTCFTDACKRSSDELATHEAKGMLKDIRSMGVKRIIVSGGEPFLREDMVDILVYAAELGIDARIASNGSLLTDDILKRLRAETLTKSFQISIETLDPDLYSTTHGVSADMLNKALAALRMIKEYGFHTTVSVRLTPETLPGIPGLLDRALDEGWATVTIHIPLHTGRTNEGFPQDADYLTYLEPVFDHFLQFQDPKLIELFIPWAQNHPVARRLENEIDVNYAGCRAGRDRLTVNPCGDISACVCFDVPEYYLGNLRRDNLEDVFLNSRICDIQRNPEKHGICKKCPDVMTCGGGCRVAAYVITGSITGNDLSCPRYMQHAKNSILR